MNKKKHPTGCFSKTQSDEVVFPRLSSVAALRGVLSSNTIP